MHATRDRGPLPVRQRHAQQTRRGGTRVHAAGGAHACTRQQDFEMVHPPLSMVVPCVMNSTILRTSAAATQQSRVGATAAAGAHARTHKHTPEHSHRGLPQSRTKDHVGGTVVLSELAVDEGLDLKPLGGTKRLCSDLRRRI